MTGGKGVEGLELRVGMGVWGKQFLIFRNRERVTGIRQHFKRSFVRVLKLGIISFIVMFLILTGISLFIPSHIHMSKVINVRADRDSIFNLLKNKEQWPRWHPAFMPSGDPEQKMLQKTSFTIISQTDSTLHMRLQQKDRKPLNTGWQLHNYSAFDSATLEWYTDFYLPWYPWQKFGSLFYESTYGAMMEKGLSNIRGLVEK
jgi:hypothetical protein